MAIYFFIFILSYISIYWGYRYEKHRTLFFLFNTIAILLPSLLAGFRDSTVGHDLEAYALPTFEDMSDVHSFQAILITMLASDLEPGYLLYTYCIRQFTDNLFYFFFVQQIIVLFCISFTAYRLRKNLNAPLLYFIYLFFFFCSSMSANRQVFAVSLIFFSSYYVLRRRPIQFSICVAIATLFHYSAILGAFIYLIEIFVKKNHKDIASHWLFLLICLGFLTFSFFPTIISTAISYGLLATKYERYIDAEFSTHKIDLACVTMYFLTAFTQKLQYIFNKRIKILCIIIFFSLLCGEYNDVAQRVALYYNLFLFVVLLMKACTTQEKPHKKMTAFIVGIVIVRWLYLGQTTGFAEAIPYTSAILGIN